MASRSADTSWAEPDDLADFDLQALILAEIESRAAVALSTRIRDDTFFVDLRATDASPMAGCAELHTADDIVLDAVADAAEVPKSLLFSASRSTTGGEAGLVAAETSAEDLFELPILTAPSTPTESTAEKVSDETTSEELVTEILSVEESESRIAQIAADAEYALAIFSAESEDAPVLPSTAEPALSLPTVFTPVDEFVRIADEDLTLFTSRAAAAVSGISVDAPRIFHKVSSESSEDASILVDECGDIVYFDATTVVSDIFVQFDVHAGTHKFCLYCRLQKQERATLSLSTWKVLSARVTSMEVAEGLEAPFQSAIVSIADILCQLAVSEDAHALLTQMHAATGKEVVDARIATVEKRTVNTKSPAEITASVDHTLRVLDRVKASTPVSQLAQLFAIILHAEQHHCRYCFVCVRLHETLPRGSTRRIPRVCNSFACTTASNSFVQHFDTHSQLSSNKWMKAATFEFFLSSVRSAVASDRWADLLHPLPMAYMKPSISTAAAGTFIGGTKEPIDRVALQRDINVLHEHIGVKQLLECRNNREIRALHTEVQFTSDGMDKLSAEIVVNAIRSHPDPLFNPTAPIVQTWPAADMLSQAAASLALVTASIDDASVRATVVKSLLPEDAYDVDRLYRLTHWVLSRIPNTLSIPDARSLPGGLYNALVHWAASTASAPSVALSVPGATVGALDAAEFDQRVSSGRLLIIQVRKGTAPPAPSVGYVFHGSSIGNWLSIADKGIKLLSNTRHMMHGAAHGPGIYVTPNFGLACQYSSGVMASRGLPTGAYPPATYDVGHAANRSGFFAVGLCRAVLSDLRAPPVPTGDSGIRVCHSESDLSLDYIAVVCPTTRPYCLPTETE